MMSKVDICKYNPQDYKSVCVPARLGDLFGLQMMVWSGRPIDVRDNRGWYPLHESAFTGHASCLQFIFQQDNVETDWTDFENNTALMLAAQKGNYHCVRVLVNAGADVNMCNIDGYSPLFRAVESKDLKCVEFLIKNGSDMHHATYSGYTPLHQAAETGILSITSLLLRYGGKPDVRCLNYGLTPLFLAVYVGHTDVVRCILDFASTVEDKQYLLQSTTSFIGDIPAPISFTQYLVNITAHDNASPLLISVQEGWDTIFDLLLEHKADPNTPVHRVNACPLQYAMWGRRIHCLGKLLEVCDLSGLYNDFVPFHPLVLALNFESTEFLEMLLNAGINPSGSRALNNEQLLELNQKTHGLYSLGCQASLLCHAENGKPLVCVRYLLSNHLSADGPADADVSPLLMAIINQNMPMVSLLLDKGATLIGKFEDLCIMFAFLSDMKRLPDTRKPLYMSWLAEESRVLHWLNNLNHSFLLRLFAVGGNVGTVLDDNSWKSSHVATRARKLCLKSGFYENIRHLKHCKYGGVIQTDPQYVTTSKNAGDRLVDPMLSHNIMSVVVPIICLSVNIRQLPFNVLKLLTDGDAHYLKSLTVKSCSLGHICRVWLLRHLLKPGEYIQQGIPSIGLPQTINQYLMLPEIDPYADVMNSLNLINPHS